MKKYLKENPTFELKLMTIEELKAIGEEQTGIKKFEIPVQY